MLNEMRANYNKSKGPDESEVISLRRSLAEAEKTIQQMKVSTDLRREVEQIN